MLMEPKPNADHDAAPPLDASPAAAGDGVFLSPRVVDRLAFEDFAGALRQLVERAAAQAGHLQSTTLEARRTHDTLQQSVAKNQSRLDRAAKALAAADQRAEQASEMLDRVQGATAALERFDAQADELIGRKLHAMAEKIGSMARIADRAQEQLGATLESVRERADALQARIEASIGEFERRLGEFARRAEGVLAPQEARLARLCDRADALLEGSAADADGKAADAGVSLPALVARVERLREEAAFATRQLDDVRKQADQARAQLGEFINASAERIDAVSDEQGRVLRALDEAVAASRTAQGEAATRADVLHAAAEATERAAAAAEETADRSREATGELRALLRQLAPWRPLLLKRDAEPVAELPPPLAAIVGAVRRDLAADLSGIATALQAIAAKAHDATASIAPEPAKRPRAVVTVRKKAAPAKRGRPAAAATDDRPTADPA